MADQKQPETPPPKEVQTLQRGDSTQVEGPVIVQVETGRREASGWKKVIFAVTVTSLFMNVILGYLFWIDVTEVTGPERHVQGTEGASDRIAVIRFTGTISPPFTGMWIKQIQKAAEDDRVRGVLMVIDSPGGLVADSHQIYNELLKLREKKPIWVQMKRIAASGGYYIAMGAGEDGRIYAEPTTWTGSIGVIVPHYNMRELGEKFGVTSDPLTTGPYKDSLNPFRDLSEPERAVWDLILADAFDRFVGVIADGRAGLDELAVRKLGTGQIYTANQAKENGMLDEIGYTEDTLDEFAESLELKNWEAVEYAPPPNLLSLIVSNVKADDSITSQIMEASIPKAMYYCSWNPWVPAN